jgi:hypothetical protein
MKKKNQIIDIIEIVKYIFWNKCPILSTFNIYYSNISKSLNYFTLCLILLNQPY